MNCWLRLLCIFADWASFCFVLVRFLAKKMEKCYRFKDAALVHKQTTTSHHITSVLWQNVWSKTNYYENILLANEDIRAEGLQISSLIFIYF